MSFKTVWTPELDAELTRLVDDKLTFTQIAREMCNSRNACIGRAHRLGLVSKSGATGGFTANLGPKKPAPVRMPKPAPTVETAVKSAGIFAQAELSDRQCAWLDGDGPFIRCEAKAISLKSYCPCHCAVAYVPSVGPARKFVVERARW